MRRTLVLAAVVLAGAAAWRATSAPSPVPDAVVRLERETDPERLAALAAELSVPDLPVEAGRRLARVAEAGDKHRGEAAMAALSALSDPDEVVLESILRRARNAEDPEVQVVAIDTAAAWMARNPALTGRIGADLAEIAMASRHEVVRGHAIQGVANVERPLSPKVMEAMGLLARTDSSPQNRLLAALALGSSPDGLELLEKAVVTEPLLDVRRVMLIHVVRAGGGEVALRRIAVSDPAVAQDVADYVEILGTDPPDSHAIFEAKFRRDVARGSIPAPLESHPH